MTTGEGGVVTTHSEETWRLLRSLRNQGRADDGGWLEHARLGFNYRFDDLRAAIGIGQLEKLDRILAGRARGRAALRRAARRTWTASTTLAPDDDDHRRSWFVYVVELAPGIDREAVIAALEADGIGTARYLPCIHLQAYMRERYGFARGALPGRRGPEPAHARAAVPRAARGGGPGARRRDAALGARRLSANRHTFGTRRHTFVRFCPAR